MMEANPYSPPKTEVADVPEAPLPGAAPFFAVSVVKLIVLSFCTLNVYQLYWFYRNWQLIKRRGTPGVQPFLRAFFAIVFCYPCFKQIRVTGDALGIKPALAAGPMAVVWIAITLTWRLPDPFWLATYGSVFALLPVQMYVDRINAAAAPGQDRNSRFTAWNWVGVVVGGLCFVLVVIAAFLPEETAAP